MKKILLCKALIAGLSLSQQECSMWSDDRNFSEKKAMYHKPTPPHVKYGRGKRKAWK